MTFNERMIEEILDWCITSSELAAELQQVRHQFFAEGDPRPLKYWPGAADAVSKERRFLAYFMLGHRLSTGETPILCRPYLALCGGWCLLVHFLWALALWRAEKWLIPGMLVVKTFTSLY